MHSLLHFFGLDSASGPAYLFWSGIGSDISELTIFVALLALYRKHNCHVAGCWRLGHYPFTDPGSGATYLLCRRHHPAVPNAAPSPEEINAMSRGRARHRRGESL